MLFFIFVKKDCVKLCRNRVSDLFLRYPVSIPSVLYVAGFRDLIEVMEVMELVIFTLN